MEINCLQLSKLKRLPARRQCTIVTMTWTHWHQTQNRLIPLPTNASYFATGQMMDGVTCTTMPIHKTISELYQRMWAPSIQVLSICLQSPQNCRQCKQVFSVPKKPTQPGHLQHSMHSKTNADLYTPNTNWPFHWVKKKKRVVAGFNRVEPV